MINNILKKPPVPLPKEENDSFNPGHSPDGINTRPLPVTPNEKKSNESDYDSDASDPPEYDKVNTTPLTRRTYANVLPNIFLSTCTISSEA